MDLSVEELLSVVVGDRSGLTNIEKVASDRLKPAWIAFAAIIDLIETEPYHNSIGSTKFQKLAYFATALGLSTGLNNRRDSTPLTHLLKPHKTCVSKIFLWSDLMIASEVFSFYELCLDAELSTYSYFR